MEEKCHKSDQCNVCRLSTTSSMCSVRNVVYAAECLRCWDDMIQNLSVVEKPPFKRKIYVGETSRSLKERSAKQINSAERLDEGSFINKHWLEFHKAKLEPPVFVFKVSKIHKDALSREIDEAVMIQYVSKTAEILNSKSEWNNVSLSRLTLSKKEWQVKKEMKEKDTNDAEELKRYQEFTASKARPSFDSAILKLKAGLTASNSNKTSSSPQIVQTSFQSDELR